MDLKRNLVFFVPFFLVTLMSQSWAQDAQEPWSLGKFIQAVLGFEGDPYQEPVHEESNPLFDSQVSVNDSVQANTDEHKVISEQKDSAVTPVAEKINSQDETIKTPEPPATMAEEVQDSREQQQIEIEQPKAEQPAASEQEPVSSVLSDLTQSVAIGFQSSGNKGYQRAKEAFAKDSSNPFIYHIIKTQSEDYWIDLINHGLNQKDLTPQDMLWIIQELVKPKVVTQKQAEMLFLKVIDENLKGKKKKQIIALFCDVSIKPDNGYFSKPHAKDRLNLLAYLYENSYYDHNFGGFFRDLLKKMPPVVADEYLAAQVMKGGEQANYDLSAWALRRFNEGYTHYNELAKMIVDHRLSMPVKEGDKDLKGSIVELIAALYKKNIIASDVFTKASTRFFIPEPAKSDEQKKD